MTWHDILRQLLDTGSWVFYFALGFLLATIEEIGRWNRKRIADKRAHQLELARVAGERGYLSPKRPDPAPAQAEIILSEYSYPPGEKTSQLIQLGALYSSGEITREQFLQRKVEIEELFE